MTSRSLPYSPPLSLFTGDDPPPLLPRVALRATSPAGVAQIACGIVRDDGTFLVERSDGRDRVIPVRGGFYDEDAFGPLPRLADGTVDLAAFGERSFAAIPQLTRFGDLPLQVPVISPLVVRTALPLVAEAAGVGESVAEALLDAELALYDNDTLFEVAEIARRPYNPAFQFGAVALAALALQRGSAFFPLYTSLPVLPGGLRPAALLGEGVGVTTVTLRYKEVLRAGQVVEDLVEGAEIGELASAVADVQAAVSALFDALLEAARGSDGQEAILALSALACVGDVDGFGHALRSDAFVFRAYAEALLLDVVLLDADGRVDEGVRRRMRGARAASALVAIAVEQLGPILDDEVLHGEEDDPRVDVLAFGPSGRRRDTLILTAGASTLPMPAAADRGEAEHVEIACLVPPDLPAPLRLSVMERLRDLARYPFARGSSLAPGHSVRAGRPIAPGSRLDAWVIYEIDEPWARRLGKALPHHPQILLAVGVTDEELHIKIDRGAEALRDHLDEDADGLVTDPLRAQA